MPTTIKIDLFQYAELSDEAKRVAKDWWLNSRDSSDYETVTDDFIACVALLGVEVATRSQRTMGGGYRDFPEVRWSLSYSQGDGAAFVGSYAYRKGAVKAITDYTGGTDKELIRIARELQAIQKGSFYKVTATMKDGAGSNLYTHSGTMAVDVEPIPEAREAFERFEREVEMPVTRLMRDLADWLYARLREQDEWLSSDEQVAEAMEANGYTFREDGRRENG